MTVSELSRSFTQWASIVTGESRDASVCAGKWLYQNHGGAAKLTGLAVVPSQFIGPGADESHRIVNGACFASGDREPVIEKFHLPDSGIQGIIVYPPDYDSRKRDQAILYNNPNGMVVARFFEEDHLSPYTPPHQLMTLFRCPVVMYDYRGTGLSSDLVECSSMRFRPTAKSIVEDGITVLSDLLRKYHRLDVVGSSLGGGVATAALEACTKDMENPEERFTLINHDSFTTTGRVALPALIADVAAWIFGAQLDAETPMKELVKRRVPITILCHDQDPVIPNGARMAELKELENASNVKVIHSPDYGHANLDWPMLRQLK